MAETDTISVPKTAPASSSPGCKQALLSLSDKKDLAFVGNGLQELGFTIVSTGGTAAALESAGVAVTKVEQLTKFPEMLDGRVKTLHPNIHGGILARRDLKHHVEALNTHGIVTSTGGIEFEDGIENIDIGGPAMIRAAAKNHKDVLVVVDSEDYPALWNFLKETRTIKSSGLSLHGKLFSMLLPMILQYLSGCGSKCGRLLRKKFENLEAQQMGRQGCSINSGCNQLYREGT
ncbi:Methylglyoxal synthase-like domain [Sesbania bispinosa]|nr:Methylglyoxal synthase-like domain [Sesbania bispinosa]